MPTRHFSRDKALGINPALFPGEKITISGTGTTFDNIVFSWANGSTYEAFSGSTLYILTQMYAGTPSGLSSSTAGFVASAAASGSSYTFSPNVTLTNGSTYYFYTGGSSNSDTGTFTWQNKGGSNGTGQFAQGTGGNYFNDSFDEDNYRLTGNSVQIDSVTPEPSSLVTAATGAIVWVAFAYRSRNRKRKEACSTQRTDEFGNGDAASFCF